MDMKANVCDPIIQGQAESEAMCLRLVMPTMQILDDGFRARSCLKNNKIHTVLSKRKIKFYFKFPTMLQKSVCTFVAGPAEK